MKLGPERRRRGELQLADGSARPARRLNWRLGSYLKGVVKKALAPGRYAVQVGKNEIICQSTVTLTPGEELTLQVNQRGEKPGLRIVTGESGEDHDRGAGVAALLERLALPDTKLHRGIVRELLRHCSPAAVQAEQVTRLAGLAVEWQVSQPAEIAALAEMAAAGVPLTRELWQRWMRRGLFLAAPVSEKIAGWSCSPAAFDRNYWQRLGLQNEARLLAGEEPVPDNLRAVLRQHASTEPAARLLQELEGMALRLTSRPANDVAVWPLVFSSDQGQFRGELRVYERTAEQERAPRRARPRVSMVLAMPHLGQVTVDCLPQGDRAYTIEIGGTDELTTGWLAAEGAPLQTALEQLLNVAIAYRPTVPRGKPTPPPEITANGKIDFCV